MMMTSSAGDGEGGGCKAILFLAFQDTMEGIVDQSQCIYTPYYCEENVWQLCQLVEKNCPQLLHHCFAVFISNDVKQVPLWCQKASKGFVLWDYHVIMIIKQDDQQQSLVYDLDTTLTFPCSFQQYLNDGIRSESEFIEKFKRKFRVIGAKEFLATFASDRRHMLMPSGSDYQQPPPTYPPIKTSMSDHNLDTFISMDSSKGVGQVMDVSELTAFFSLISKQ